jgi:hypothetical protein
VGGGVAGRRKPVSARGLLGATSRRVKPSSVLEGMEPMRAFSSTAAIEIPKNSAATDGTTQQDIQILRLTTPLSSAARGECLKQMEHMNLHGMVADVTLKASDNVGSFSLARLGAGTRGFPILIWPMGLFLAASRSMATA